ncbi:MAG: hypothetical protein ACJ75G_02195 [Gaiellaceae bacterium]
MTAAQLRERVTKTLLNEIEQVQYPSSSMLNRVEATLADHEALAEYAETLVEKFEATRFPSTDLLNRLDALFGRLELAEQQERQRHEAG